MPSIQYRSGAAGSTINYNIRMNFCHTMRFLCSTCEIFFSVQAIASDFQESPEILGQKVLAVQAAINNPDLPESMSAILALGHDSRYYVMVRGWLSQELEGSQSRVDALQPKINSQLDNRIVFLQKAIRAIDLE